MTKENHDNSRRT